MQVLIIGGGGREHALGWKLAQSPQLTRLWFAPGNPGTATLGENVSLAVTDPKAVTSFAQEKGIDLVIVGPEAPLVAGVADALDEVGIACFGPNAAAAALEGSKIFAKEVMHTLDIPTASYRSFDDYQVARAHARNAFYPSVLKADGLAGGKGVTICANFDEMDKALSEVMEDGRFGEAGSRVVIEEFLDGTEASFHLISDGERVLPLITAQDHKALYDGNRGPNTGGMGTFSPNSMFTPELMEIVLNDICGPVLKYMRDRGTPFRGVLFTGLMVTGSGPKVLEFNVRFGDPETQVMMPMLDYDLLPILYGAARGQLPEGEFPWKKGAATCVVLTAEGYPGSVRKGDAISDLPTSENGIVFQAGTCRDDQGQLITNGGRVLGATAWAEDPEVSRQQAYHLAEQVQFEGRYFRTDIGGNNDES